MSTGSPSQVPEPIVVDVEADPRAAQPAPNRWGSVRWLILGLALIAVVTGAVIGRPEPHRPDVSAVVRGLEQEPSFVWQRELEGIETATAVGDAVAVHPIIWHGDELVVELLDPADGQSRWSRDFSEYVTVSSAATLLVRDLPGTDRLTVTLRAFETVQQTMLVDAADGRVVDSLELPWGSTLATTDRGQFVLVTGEELLSEIAWLGADPDPSNPAWRAEFELPGFGISEATALRFREYGSHLGIGIEWSGFWHGILFHVIRLDDGEQIHQPEWLTSFTPFHFVAETVVVEYGGDLSAYDADTGERLWQTEMCRCRLYEAGDSLFMLTGDNPGVADLHLLDPWDGSVIWEAAIPEGPRSMFPSENWPRITVVGDRLVDSRSIDGDESGSGQTCITPFDGETGDVDETHCFDGIPVPLIWPGEDQLILGYQSTDGPQSIRLTAVALTEAEPRWHLTLPADSGWIDVLDSRLVIYDETNGTVGALG